MTFHGLFASETHAEPEPNQPIMAFYLQPPCGKISYENLWKFASVRFQYLMSLKKSSAYQLHVPEEDIKGDNKENEKGGGMKIEDCDCLIEGTAKDEVSHFILRLVMSLYPETSKFFKAQETHLFCTRIRLMTHRQLARLLKKTHAILSRYKNNKLIPAISTATQTFDMILQSSRGNWQVVAKKHKDGSLSTFRASFDTVPDLVAKRLVCLQGGIAMVPFSLLDHVLKSVFSALLEAGLAEASVVSPVQMYSDVRIEELATFIKRKFDKIEKTHSLAIDQKMSISLPNIEYYAQFFPPCMKSLHMELKENKRLRHNNRIMYTLYLKEIGMSMEQGLDFWKYFYSQESNRVQGSCSHGWDDRGRRYEYNIRHMYGQEGARKDYRGHCCASIQNTSFSVGDHGCPFKHFDGKHLENLLFSMHVGQSGDIIHAAKKGDYSMACGMTQKQMYLHYKLHNNSLMHSKTENREKLLTSYSKAMDVTKISNGKSTARLVTKPIDEMATAGSVTTCKTCNGKDAPRISTTSNTSKVCTVNNFLGGVTKISNYKFTATEKTKILDKMVKAENLVNIGNDLEDVCSKMESSYFSNGCKHLKCVCVQSSVEHSVDSKIRKLILNEQTFKEEVKDEVSDNLSKSKNIANGNCRSVSKVSEMKTRQHDNQMCIGKLKEEKTQVKTESFDDDTIYVKKSTEDKNGKQKNEGIVRNDKKCLIGTKRKLFRSQNCQSSLLLSTKLLSSDTKCAKLSLYEDTNCLRNVRNILKQMDVSNVNYFNLKTIQGPKQQKDDEDDDKDHDNEDDLNKRQKCKKMQINKQPGNFAMEKQNDCATFLSCKLLESPVPLQLTAKGQKIEPLSPGVEDRGQNVGPLSVIVRNKSGRVDSGICGNKQRKSLNTGPCATDLYVEDSDRNLLSAGNLNNCVKTSRSCVINQTENSRSLQFIENFNDCVQISSACVNNNRSVNATQNLFENTSTSACSALVNKNKILESNKNLSIVTTSSACVNKSSGITKSTEMMNNNAGTSITCDSFKDKTTQDSKLFVKQLDMKKETDENHDPSQIKTEDSDEVDIVDTEQSFEYKIEGKELFFPRKPSHFFFSLLDNLDVK